jgi:hypothetical protein
MVKYAVAGVIDMLVLPIVNRKRVMNVEIKLKNAEKIRSGVCYDDALESEIIINREKFSESSYKDSKDENAPIDFIRSRSLLYPRNFLVTTKEENDSSLYDVYEVAPPPKKVNDGLDKLYSKAITDLRKEIPGTKKRGRYVSFEKLGIDKHLTEEKIAMLQRIVKEERDESLWPRKFAEAGIADLSDTIDFITNFECTVLSDTSIPEERLQDTLKALQNINTRDYRNLNNYYKMAKSNTDIYTKISYINKIIYDKPLTLIQSQSQKQKQLVKKMDEVEQRHVA